MADAEQLAVLQQGVEVWNEWLRLAPTKPRIDLEGADLRGRDLRRVNFWGAKLGCADLSGSDLSEAKLNDANFHSANVSGANLAGAEIGNSFLNNTNFTDANLSDTYLYKADLYGARLCGADLTGARLIHATLIGADFSRAILRGTWLERSMFVKTKLTNATLSDCHIYGISAWDVELDGATQSDLIITQDREPKITVDSLDVAQFIYLLLHNEQIRRAIDTITSKVVLILGRFTNDRKPVLNAIRDALRNNDYLPVLFDFDKPATRDTHETITTLARMAKFVIADITEPKSIPQELVSIVEQLPSLPVQPILCEGSEPWGMYDHIRRYPWVLEIRHYRGLEDLIPHLADTVLAPAEKRIREMAGR